MPELPDVEVFRRYLDATALHKTVESVTVREEGVLEGVSAQTLRDALTGRSLAETRRHGKYLLARLEPDRDGRDWLVMHFGMTGYLEYFKDQDQDPRHDRVRLDLDNGYHLAFVSQRKLGRMLLKDSPEALVRDKDLGPDAMDLDREGFKQALAGTRSMVKSAFMRQERMAGVGNVYTDEILFQAGVHPKARSTDLDNDVLDELYRTMRHVLQTAADRKADPEAMPDSWLLPRREEGASCPRCKGGLQKLRVNGRATYVCPSCQKIGKP
jgi:formamidopyrimidine-DNA glycosylase